MSVNKSHPGRGLGFPGLNSSPPNSSPWRRVSVLIRRGRSVFSKYVKSIDDPILPIDRLLMNKRPTHDRDVSRTSSIPLTLQLIRRSIDWPRDSSGSQTSQMDSSQRFVDPAAMVGLSQGAAGDSFDIFDWYPHYQICQRYFLDHAQHSASVQALSAFLNIRLPFQRQPNPVLNSSADPSSLPLAVSLIPYLRRLVATGMDFPGVLHGFFGDDWGAGLGLLHEQERRNYLFAAKSGGWAAVKKDYDIPPLETIPFLRPLQGPLDSEIEAAERSWSEWLAMEDWMVGPRAPDVLRDSSSQISRPRSSRG